MVIDKTCILRVKPLECKFGKCAAACPIYFRISSDVRCSCSLWLKAISVFTFLDFVTHMFWRGRRLGRSFINSPPPVAESPSAILQQTQPTLCLRIWTQVFKVSTKTFLSAANVSIPVLNFFWIIGNDGLHWCLCSQTVRAGQFLLLQVARCSVSYEWRCRSPINVQRFTNTFDFIKFNRRGASMRLDP